MKLPPPRNRKYLFRRSQTKEKPTIKEIVGFSLYIANFLNNLSYILSCMNVSAHALSTVIFTFSIS